MGFSRVSKRGELSADHVIERTLRANLSLDPLRRPALLRPDFLEPLETSGLQSSKTSHCICDALLPCHDIVSLSGRSESRRRRYHARWVQLRSASCLAFTNRRTC